MLSDLFVFILMEMHTAISQQSSEDVNSILDKLIQQVSDYELNYDDESQETVESFYPVPIDTETELGDYSNIYYFKTYMAPQVEFKNGAQRFDKSVQMANNQFETLSEDKLLPGTRTARSGTNDEVDILQSRKSDDADKINKMKLIENFIKKYNSNEFSSGPSEFGRILSKPLKKLNKHPEVVVGELRNNNNSDALTLSDTELKNTTPLKEISSSTNNTPKPDSPKAQKSLKEKSVLEDDEKLKNLIGSQNEALYDRLLKEISKRDSREENILLEKIVKILSASEVKEDEPNFESRAVIPYPVAQLSSKMSNSKLLKNLQGNIVSPVYLHPPVVTHNLSPRISVMPYLPRILSLSRNNALQKVRFENSLVNRGLSRYTLGRHLPVHYG